MLKLKMIFSFKIFGILNENFFPIKEVNLTNCKIVKYSNGGHFLIASSYIIKILK